MNQGGSAGLHTHTFFYRRTLKIVFTLDLTLRPQVMAEPLVTPVYQRELDSTGPNMNLQRQSEAAAAIAGAKVTTSKRLLTKDPKGSSSGSSRKPLVPLVNYKVVSDPTSSGMTEEIMKQIDADPKTKFDDSTLIKLIFEEFPAEVKAPTVEDIDDSILRSSTTGLPFEKGQWIERLGNDMTWHLEPIRRVVRIANGEDSFDYFYKTSAGLLVPVDKCRASEEGLKRHFGMRPWVWQQWANLRVEDYLRFQKVRLFFKSNHFIIEE